MRWRGTATLISSSFTRRFLPAPRSRRTATVRTADGPKVRTVECGTSVQIVGGRLLAPEGHSRSLVGEHRSNVFFFR